MVIEGKIIRAYSDEIVNLYFDGYTVKQAIELIQSCEGVIECKMQPLDAAAPIGNVQMQENV